MTEVVPTEMASEELARSGNASEMQPPVPLLAPTEPLPDNIDEHVDVVSSPAIMQLA